MDTNRLPAQYVVQLTEDEKRQIAQIISSLKQQFPESTYTPQKISQTFDDQLLKAVHKSKESLPERVKKAVATFVKESNSNGALLVKGLELGELPPNPADGGISPDKRSTDSEFTILLLTSLLGVPITYTEALKIGVIQSVSPVKGKERVNAYVSSIQPIGFHTEFSFHPIRPDYITLMCLRQDHEGVAKTPAASIELAMKKLTDEQIKTLEKPIYSFSTASLFGNDTAGIATPPFPVITYGSNGKPLFRIQLNGIECIDPVGEPALVTLRKVLEEVAVGVALQHGDLLMIDNAKAAHARSAFVPKYDGHDRWLQRMWIRREAPDGRYLVKGGMTDGNVISPFKELVENKCY